MSVELDPVIREAREVGAAHGEAHARYMEEFGDASMEDVEPSVPHRFSINEDRESAYLTAYEDAVSEYNNRENA